MEEILNLNHEICQILKNNGYSHYLKVSRTGKKYSIWLADDNDFCAKTYGGESGYFSRDKAITFLTGYLEGLEMGIL